jgi:hypothetical protein
MTSVLFDGTDDYVDCGNDSALWSQSLTKFSFSFWIYCTAVPLTNRTLVTHGYNTNQSFICHRDNGNGNVVLFRVRSSAGVDATASTSSVSILNKWAHITCVYDNSLVSNNVKLYKNGVVCAFPGNGTATINLSAALTLNGVILGYQAGRIRDFRWWTTKPLTQAEIDLVRTDDPTAPAPDFWLKMDEGTGNPVDSITGTKVGTLTNGANWGLASSTIISLYDIRQLALSSIISKYDILKNALSQIISKYDIRQLVSSTTISKYDIRQLITPSSVTSLYDLFQNASSQITSKYDIRQIASSEVTGIYDIFKLALSQIVSKYDIRQLASSTVTSIYDLFQNAMSEITSVYNILVGGAVSEITARYNIRQLASSSMVSKYDIRQLASSTITSIYDLLGGVFSEVISKYNIRKLASSAITAIYNIVGGDTTNTDVALLITNWLRDNWTDNPYSTVDHYLIPPKDKITFGRRFDLTSGSHSDVHIHVRSVHENPEFISTDATLQDNSDIVNIYVEVRFIPDTPVFTSDSPSPPSRMMWHIRSYIDELIRSNPEQLSNVGIDAISLVQELPDSNTFPDVHGQSAIEQLYTIIFTVKVFYAFRIGRVA